MFIFQSDWKVIPMAALIAGLVSMAIGSGLFVSQEGTLQGAFALACVCIWNGFFNSIQVICRERPIIKREHRAGMHISSYVAAHLIYQMIICIAQSLITILVLNVTQVKLNLDPLIFKDFRMDLAVTMFLITYSADTLALLVSSIVHSTTTAMTVMPFLLIVQLVFAGFFSLPESLNGVSDLMISKWGVQCLCAIGNYNDQPAVVIWNKLVSSGNKIEVGPGLTMMDILHEVEELGLRDEVLAQLGKANYNAKYESTTANVYKSWGILVLFVVVFSFVTVAFLEFIDKDKR
ncbi:MAG: ABC transporter permease [Butyrivibrio sp.]|nr:ABC transporter permease [Butyrivibrio sp.]